MGRVKTRSMTTTKKKKNWKDKLCVSRVYTKNLINPVVKAVCHTESDHKDTGLKLANEKNLFIPGTGVQINTYDCPTRRRIRYKYAQKHFTSLTTEEMVDENHDMYIAYFKLESFFAFSRLTYNGDVEIVAYGPENRFFA